MAEKEHDKKARNDNEILLLRIPPIDGKLSDHEIEKRLDEILKSIENSLTSDYTFDKSVLEKSRSKHGFWYSFVRQSEMPRDEKWISMFFGKVEDIVEEIEKHPLMIKAGEWFKPSYGNALYLCLSSWGVVRGVRNLGSKEFFYFSRDKIEEWENKEKGFRNVAKSFLVPAITASRYVKIFTFTRADWERIRDLARKEKMVTRYPANAWILVLHEDRKNLPSQLQKYIEWGETECKTKIKGSRGGGRICKDAEACKTREEIGMPFFYGWYDLGGYIPAPIMAIRQARYHPQFFLVSMPLITYDAIIAFIPRVRTKIGNQVYDPQEFNRSFNRTVIDELKGNIKLDETELKAILAYLNSTFNWLWLEQNARYIAKGPLGLEVSIARKMPVLNVKILDRKHVEELARLFDELETRARQISGESLENDDTEESAEIEEEEEQDDRKRKLEMFRKLRPVFKKIDDKIAEILGIAADTDELWSYAWEMMERRIKGAGRKVKPGVEVEINTRENKMRDEPPLTKWIDL